MHPASAYAKTPVIEEGETSSEARQKRIPRAASIDEAAAAIRSHDGLMIKSRHIPDINRSTPRVMKLTPVQEEIVWLLLDREIVTHAMLQSHLWEDDADGGPENVPNRTDVYVSKVRTKLRPFGFDVENVRDIGYRMPDWQRKELRLWCAALGPK